VKESGEIKMTQVTLIGNAVGEPNLAFSKAGDAAASFTVAVNERVKQGDQWVDGEATFYRVTAWRKLGEQSAELIKKGDRVMVAGKLKAKTYTTKDGQEKLSLEVTADEVGKSIRFEKTNNAPTPIDDSWAATFDEPPF